MELLQTEIEQLEGLAVSMNNDLEELERGRARTKYARTWKGKVWNLVNMIFAIYCAYRFIVVSYRELGRRATYNRYEHNHRQR